MKLMVSLLLLVAVCHAAEVSRSRQEDDERTAKRELEEGNFGLKIQPSLLQPGFSNSQSAYDSYKNNGLPQGEYGPPRQPVAKISDVLSGQGSSFPAAINSHLYSPVRIYQPRLGSPTTFEVSQPVPSQLAYSEHKIYQATPTIQGLNENLQALNQNVQPSQPTILSQQSPVQFNSFPAFAQLQQARTPQPILQNEFFPRVENTRLLPNQGFPQQIYQQVYSQQPGSSLIPQDIYQINQLGNQITYEETVQLSQGSDGEVRGNKVSENGKQQQQKPGIQYVSTQESQDQSQKIKYQEREPQQSSIQQSNNVEPQAVSYASFSQSLPISAQRPNQEQQEQEQKEQEQQEQEQQEQKQKEQEQQEQEQQEQEQQEQEQQEQEKQEQEQPSPEPLPQQQQLPQSQQPPLFQPSQSTQAQSTFHSVETTPPSQTTLFTETNQTPRNFGIVRTRQETTTPQPLTINTFEPQDSSTSSVTASDNLQPTTTLQQSQFSEFSTLPANLQSNPTLKPLTSPTLAPRTTFQSSTSQSQSNYASRPISPPLPRQQQATSQTFSTFPFSTLPPQPLITESRSTLPPQPAVPTLSQATSQPVLIQQTLTPLPLFQPQQIQSISSQPQHLTTLQPLQPLTSLQPSLVTQSQPLRTSTQTDSAGIRPIPVQRQQYQKQPESQSAIQLQENKSEEKTQQQLLQQSQLQFIQEPQQIQQQLQSIQQQLQYIQQQPQLFQPQPAQITQQQTYPFPQLVQQELIPSQPLVQQQPLQQQQFIQQQPISQQQLQQFQVIQQQPRLFQEQPQLIQQQPQPIQFVQKQQVQQQPQSSSTPQPEVQQKPQQEQQENKQSSQQKEKSENQETNRSLESNEGEDYYAQLLNNNLYSQELYIQPQHLHPVPVAFPSYSSPSLYAQSYPSTQSYPSVQFFGNYAPSIFGKRR